MSIDPPVCMDCVHFVKGSLPPSCKAFPNKIPDSIWLEGDDHRGPIEGDHGIRFEAKEAPRA